ncbi:MAG: DUF378 domain-containing protein [Firmicutes bacterium]|nr:DUF378 domain-containing protein [Bacillota bacterium]
METIQKIALVLTVIGAINWGLIGLLDFNLVAMITGNMDLISNIIYILVGLAGLVNIMLLFYHYEPAK